MIRPDRSLPTGPGLRPGRALVRRGIAPPPPPPIGAASRPARGPLNGGRSVERPVAVTPLLRDPYRLCLLGLVIENTSHVTSYLGPLWKFRPGLVLFCFAMLFALASQAKS